MSAQPSVQFREPHARALVQLDQKAVCVEVVELDPIAVHPQESGGDGHGDSLVAIDEWVILR